MVAIVKKHKPTSPGRRGYISVKDENISKTGPCKQLTVNLGKTSSGRNSAGRITVRRRGGGHKRLYRLIDFRRNKDGITAKVKTIEYDPNRSAYIALLQFADGEKRYIIAPEGLKVGDTVSTGAEAPIATGNALPLMNIPVGTQVHCIELKPGKGAQLARSAGCSVQLLAKEGSHALLRLKSGEVRYVLQTCRAAIGVVSKSQHNLQKLGKAGRSRWKNKRPKVRGVVMNPVDHPLGGGEGRSSGGRPPCSPWGLPEGTKTRKRKYTTRLIVRRRKNKSEKK